MSRLSWPMVGFVAVLGAITVALAAVAGWTPEAILGVLGILAGIGGGAAVASGVAGRVDAVALETQHQTAQLVTIERRVNGELDTRIAAAVERGNEDLLRTLRRAISEESNGG